MKGTEVRAASSPDEEPDFYSMPFVNAKGKFSVSKNSDDAVVGNSNCNHACGKSAAKKETSPTGTSTNKSKTSSKSSRRTNRNRKSTPGIRRKGGGYERSTNSSSTDEDISSKDCLHGNVGIIGKLLLTPAFCLLLESSPVSLFYLILQVLQQQPIIFADCEGATGRSVPLPDRVNLLADRAMIFGVGASMVSLKYTLQ